MQQQQAATAAEVKEMGATSASGAVIAGGEYGSVALKVEGGTLFQYQVAYQFKQEQKVIELLLDLRFAQKVRMPHGFTQQAVELNGDILTLQPVMDYKQIIKEFQ